MIRKFLVVLVAAMMALATSGTVASAQSYPPGPTIGVSVGTDGSLTVNSGDFVGDIVITVGDTEVYRGPASGAVGLTGIAPGAQITITGMNAAGEVVQSNTTVQGPPTVTPPTPPTPPIVVAPPVPPIVVSPPVAPVIVVAPAPAVVVAPAAPKTSPALAVTGSSASVPVLLGTALLAAGGLAVLAGRKRAAVES